MMMTRMVMQVAMMTPMMLIPHLTSQRQPSHNKSYCIPSICSTNTILHPSEMVFYGRK